ncbi:MAG: response regulator transcription factor [Allosphingosinicella sp.]|uniref:response regulator transcription factor n=1 Tax=Allosphingosinicella sp. TaxID=2823234 RepID=UPI0039438BB9
MGGHEPSPEQVCNAGRCFSRCRRCGAELMEEDGKWKPIPPGYRIVWRDKEGAPAPAPTLAPTAPAPSPSPPPAPEPPSLPPAREIPAEPEGPVRQIMVCDDDPLLADLLTHKLSGRGYRVTVAEDGAEALAKIAADPPDAILLDAMMPMMDGYEVLRRIREDPRLASVPVVMLTARKQEQDIVRALSLGADDFVVKPFIPEELLSRLARLIERR